MNISRCSKAYLLHRTLLCKSCTSRYYLKKIKAVHALSFFVFVFFLYSYVKHVALCYWNEGNGTYEICCAVQWHYGRWNIKHCEYNICGCWYLLVKYNSKVWHILIGSMAHMGLLIKYGRQTRGSGLPNTEKASHRNLYQWFFGWFRLWLQLLFQKIASAVAHSWCSYQRQKIFKYTSCELLLNAKK